MYLKRFKVLIIAILCFFSLAAHAGTITQNVLTSHPNSTVLSFERFDDSLGTLLQVSLTSQLEWTYKVTNKSPDIVTGAVGFTHTLTSDIFNDYSITSLDFYALSTGMFVDKSGTTDDVTTLMGSMLGLFLGSGTVDIGSVSYGFNNGGFSSSEYLSQNNYTLAYSYASAAPVPEPSAIALMGLGLLGFVATRRRKLQA